MIPLNLEIIRIGIVKIWKLKSFSFSALFIVFLQPHPLTAITYISLELL